MSPDDRAARLATRQAGNVTRRQLQECGLSRGDIQARIARGALRRRFRSVFAVGHVPEGRPSLAFAAWLAYGPDAGLSHRDCAAALDVLEAPSGPVHVIRATGGRSQPGTVLHEGDGELWRRNGILLTSPARLMLDLAATEPHAVVERAWNEAQVRRLITPARLARRLEDWEGRRGIGVLRSLVEDAGVSRSALEDRFTRILRQSGLRPDGRNEWVDGVFVDAVWRRQRVVVELDGRDVHGAGRAFEADRRKANALQLRGWIVLRFTYRRLRDEPMMVVAEVVAALHNRGLVAAA